MQGMLSSGKSWVLQSLEDAARRVLNTQDSLQSRSGSEALPGVPRTWTLNHHQRFRDHYKAMTSELAVGR